MKKEMLEALERARRVVEARPDMTLHGSLWNSESSAEVYGELASMVDWDFHFKCLEEARRKVILDCLDRIATKVESL